MDPEPAIDIKQRMSEQIAQVARSYFDNQRAKPGATGASRDGTVEVTLDGLGDVTNVVISADDVPDEVATRLAESVKQAWMAAARSVAVSTAEDNPLAQRAGMAELVDEQISQRYGEPEPEPEPIERPDDDEDFGERSPINYT